MYVIYTMQQFLCAAAILCGILSTAPLLAQEEDVQESQQTQQQGRISSGDSTANYKQLQTNIATILSTRALSSSKFGAAIYSLDKQRMIFEKNANDLLTPASTTKLFFTSAAMKVIGADKPVPTQIYTDGTLTKDGTLTGNVYVVGRGDCFLSVSDIEQLADQLTNMGVKSINGQIIGDGTYFDNVTDRQAYSGDAERMQDLPPITALTVNKNRVTVIVRASNSGRPSVQTIPSSDGFSIGFAATPPPAPAVATPSPKVSIGKKQKHSLAKTKPQKGITKIAKKAIIPKKQQKPPAKPRKRAMLEANEPALMLADNCEVSFQQEYGDRIILRKKPKAAKIRRARLSVSSSMRDDGVQQFFVNGTPGKNATQSYTYEIKNPALVVAGILQRSLRANGVVIRGNVKTGATPQSAKLLTQFNRPLYDLVSVVNKNSDNYVAEHVMKIVGAYCCGGNQCNINAFKTVGAMMDSAGMTFEGCQLFDGSGLSRRNKTSPMQQLNLLRFIAQQPFGGVFYSTLSIAGVDGTLGRRMRGTAAENNVHAKTGTHGNVSALSGYTRTRDGERIAFSFQWNGNNVGMYKYLENLLAIQLSEFSYTSGTTQLPTIR